MVSRTAGNTTVTDGSTARITATALNAVTIKRVTILCLNIRRFYKTVNFAIPSTVINPTTDMTETISAVANQHKGVIDAFHGDHFVISFNAARANADGPVKAARAAMDILQIFNEEAEEEDDSSESEAEGDEENDDLKILENQNASERRRAMQFGGRSGGAVPRALKVPGAAAPVRGWRCCQRRHAVLNGPCYGTGSRR